MQFKWSAFVRGLVPGGLLLLGLASGVLSSSCSSSGVEESLDLSEVGPSVELLDLGDQLFAQDRYTEAKRMYARAVRANGPNHAYVEACAQVARMESLLGNLQEGKPWLDLAGRRADIDDPLGWSRLQLVVGIYERESGAEGTALQRFKALYEYCLAAELYERAIDAAHHVVLVSTDIEEQMAWSQKGIDAADAGGMYDWLAVLWNNKGAALEDEGRWEDALVAYEAALEYHREGGDRQRILIANWAVARAQRMTGRLAEARALSSRNLEVARERYDEDPSPNNAEWVGYCTWEIAELAYLDGMQQQAVMGLFAARASLVQAGIETWGAFGVSELARLDARILELDPSAELPAAAAESAQAESVGEGTEDAAVKAAAEEPAVAPVDVPAEKAVEAPVEKPVEAPAEKHAETPVETPTEAPAETPKEKPSDAPKESPAEEPAEGAGPANG